MSTSAQAAPPSVLSFAASDPTSGAGMQADLLTLAALGCHPLSVVTAITAQDTRGVANLWPLASAWIAEQARVLLDDVRVAAFKAGVLASADNVRAVGDVVQRYSQVPFVVDPVFASGRGDALADDEAIDAVREAQEFTWHALAAGFAAGRGQLLPNRFYGR